MPVINSIILGIIHALTEFLPVSSFGLLLLFRRLLGVGELPGVLFETTLHLGTALCVVVVFWRDFSKILAEIIGMAIDLAGNIHVWVHNRRTQEEDLPYHTLVSGTWRKLSAMVLAGCIPSAMIGYSARRLVRLAAASSFLPGALMLVTAVFLLVTDLSQADEKAVTRDAGYDSALWAGISQGVAVFPGISQLGLSMCSGIFCGQSRRFAVKFSVILSVPAILGAFVSESAGLAQGAVSTAMAGSFLAGALAAFATAYLTIHFMIRLSQQVKLRWFALLNFALGVISLTTVF